MPRRITPPEFGYGWSTVGCCIACGGFTLFTVREDVVFLQHEKWKHFTNTHNFEGEEPDMPASTLVEAKEIEKMYIPGDSWMWTTFYRAIIHRQDINHLGISGITQGFLEYNLAPVPQVPRDAQKARIGDPYNNPVRSACTRFQPTYMSELNTQKEVKQIGYMVHAHCWLLVDRVISMELVDTHLAIFVKAVQLFWLGNNELYWALPADDDSTDPELWDLQNSEVKVEPPSSMWKNPAIVPEIQEIVEQATIPRRDDDVSNRMWLSPISHIPLEVAIQITDITKWASISDARNLLTAFGWRLPNSYWQSCIRMDLIFEYDDIRKTSHPVDWQFLGLATEELLENSDWYDKSGLKTRQRVFQFLGQIKGIFLDLLEKNENNHGFRKRVSRRKNFL